MRKDAMSHGGHGRGIWRMAETMRQLDRRRRMSMRARSHRWFMRQTIWTEHYYPWAWHQARTVTYG